MKMLGMIQFYEIPALSETFLHQYVEIVSDIYYVALITHV